MNSGLPDIDLRNIRPFGSPASRAGGFEELACILLEDGAFWPWPAGTAFNRFGNPDGGREGRAVLPDGSVSAWQAKYLFELDASALSQVERSFRRALETEAALAQYVVVLPIDLTAGDSSKRASAQTRWDAAVASWSDLAAQSGRTVDFKFIGQHQIVKVLGQPAGHGRLRYWFGTTFMDAGWFRARFEVAEAKAGKRYTPELHVPVDAVRALHAVARTDEFATEWREALAELRTSRRYTWSVPEGDDGSIANELPLVEKALDRVDALTTSFVSSLSDEDVLLALEEEISAARDCLGQIMSLLYTKHLKGSERERYFVGTAGSLHGGVQNASMALESIDSLSRSAVTRAACTGELVISGSAGSGKTHLLCDFMERCMQAGIPAVLLMGQDFSGRSMSGQLSQLASYDGTLDELIQGLGAAAEASGDTAVLLIDALNESEMPEHWVDELSVLRVSIARNDNVALAVSCRSEFLTAVVGDSDMPEIEHRGFGEATETAVMRFAHEYGIEAQSFPVLNPEFANPLFLKLTCEALQTLGQERFPLGSAALTTVCGAFVEAVNARLAVPQRCDFDPSRNLVQKAVRMLASAGRDGVLGRETARAKLEELLPGRTWSRSLMQGLLAEGLLIETANGIGFGYQRLGDVARASVLVERPAEGVKAWIESLGTDRWRQRGVLGALAIMLPEQNGVEILDLLDELELASGRDDLMLFIDSLVLRSADAVGDRTQQIVRQMLNDDGTFGAVCELLVRLSCVPDHPLNSRWTHAWLKDLELAERDARWTRWLVGQTEDQTPIRRLITWARDTDLETSDDVRSQAGLMLAWMLTASDARVRDQATKALVALLEPTPGAARDVLCRFRDTNDPYVTERLAGIACGIATRSRDDVTHADIADGVAGLIGGSWPSHLFTRDYARRVFDLAFAAEWQPPPDAGLDAEVLDGPPYGSEFPNPSMTTSEIEELTDPADNAYFSIWHSLTGFVGDFGIYVLSPALSRFQNDTDIDLSEVASRFIFERVLELGWRPELFAEFDRHRRWEPSRGSVVERIGKKYQWIAFYELLGRLADHLWVNESWNEDPPSPYGHAEQVAWRDIDPTVIVRKPQSPKGEPGVRWFAPAAAVFSPEDMGRYPNDAEGVPDPLDLIVLAGADGDSWLTVETYQEWNEPLTPEVAALHRPYLCVWMQVRGYIIDAANADELAIWAADQDWNGRWMPEAAEVHCALLATHPRDPQWSFASGMTEWWRADEKRPPCNMWTGAAMYEGTGTSRDQSADRETYGLVPSGLLHDLVGLNGGKDFLWTDHEGAVVALDPSVSAGGETSLVVDRDVLLTALSDNGLTLFWTVLVGKDLMRGSFGDDDSAQQVSASASYVLAEDSVRRCGASARALSRSAPDGLPRDWNPSLERAIT
ncbi:MAG: hypothetical protein F4Z53_01095 [Acidimicrobiales bacterium]|nr:hypothetical protein [Acidimicrobiaceae bacterium]MXX41631.1 hypothetical protein [Acidimicrobiales bacterium]MYD33335.1 hypothetical protein [Acidimicrobiales bacterium]MYI09513.1 hypothetical protein [Acidimicrobiales bacterium]